MGGKRRRFAAAFKAKVAMADAMGDHTTTQLASQFGIHASQTPPSFSPPNCLKNGFRLSLMRGIDTKSKTGTLPPWKGWLV